MRQRITAIILLVVMLITMLPLNAFAEGAPQSTWETENETAVSNVETTGFVEEMPSQDTSEVETEPVRETTGLDSIPHLVTANNTVSPEIYVQVVAGAKQQDGKWVWSPTNNADGHKFIFGISYSSSGVGEIQAGELEIRIPMTLLVDREGQAADELELSIPHESELEGSSENELEQIDLVWKQDGDEIVMYNYKAISAAQNGYVEVSYNTTKQVNKYEDMAEQLPFHADYNVIVDGECYTAESNEAKVYINTQVKIKSTEKKFPVYYHSWQNEWGQAPEDADDFLYLVWEIRTIVDETSNQSYRFELNDELISSTLGNVSVVGYRMAGTTGYCDVNYADNQTATGYRYDYVLTKQPKEEYSDLDLWNVTNKITATVIPEDGIDSASSASAQKQFTWKKPTFDKPVGRFNIFVRADGAYRKDPKDKYVNAPPLVAGDYSRYDLNDFQDGDIEFMDGLDYAAWYVIYPTPWTLEPGADPFDPNNYGKVPVSMKMEINGAELHNEADEFIPIGAGDYQIDSIHYSITMRDFVYNESTAALESCAVTYTDDDIVYFYGQYENDGEYVLIAKKNLKTKENWFDPTYVESMSNTKIVPKDGLLAYKFETANAHYFTQIITVPNISLLNSERVMGFVENEREVSVKINGWGNFSNNDGVQLAESTEQDSDFVRQTQRDSYLDKKVVASKNLPKKKSYVITWRIRESELATFGEGSKQYIPQQSGVFYDLLPEGCILDVDSVSVQGEKEYLNDSEYVVQQIQNYKNSGRTLVIVSVNSAEKRYVLYYDTIHPWESIRDYGADIYNPVAYETGNDAISHGYPDNGGRSNLTDAEDWNDQNVFESPFTEYFTNLDVETDECKFIYAMETYDIQAITTAAAGLTKRVMSVGDTGYSYETTTTIDGDYQYRLRFMNTFTSSTKELILFDSLENYKTDDIESDWHGELQSIDLSQLVEQGIAPVVYISRVEALNLEGETNYVPNNDLTNEDVWTVWDGVESLGDVTAIAVDARKSANDEDYILPPGEAISVTLHFKAPKHAESDGTYPQAYNNVYVSDVVRSVSGTETSFFIHQDYTIVTFVVRADFEIVKVSSEDENVKIPGIKFKLSGVSDYGEDVSMILETNSKGRIKFENVEKGSYILQEYETNDDWLFDGTEHHVVVSGDGHVTIDGQDVTSGVFTIANAPRVHGNIRIQKIPEDMTREWNSDGDTTDVPENDDTDTVTAKAEPSVEMVSGGIPDTIFKFYGVSDYGTDVFILATTNHAGVIVFNNIEKGTYTLEEAVPNSNYLLNATKWTVTIDENGNGVVREPGEADRDRLYFVTEMNNGFAVENENRYWNVKLYKADSYNLSLFLEGATFELFGTSDLGTEYHLTETTNDQGYLMFMNLEKGSYILRETVAPTGVDENGRLGGNRNYILDPNDHIVTIDERGNVTITGAILTASDEIALTNDRAMDGTITITKIWKDFDPSNRQTPKLHLSTREIAVDRNVNVTINWSGEGDTADVRPSSVKLYIGTEDGTVIAGKTVSLAAPDNPTNVIMTALLDPEQTYYVWAENAKGYEALTNINRKAQITYTEGKPVGVVNMKKFAPTILLPGITFRSRVGQNMTSFTRVESIPDGVTKFTLSTATSGLPVYGWKDGTDVYWYSEADPIYMNPDCSGMFCGCKNIKYLDLRDFDSSKVTTMSQMFYIVGGNLETVLHNFDTSNVTNMGQMFSNCTKLRNLDVSGFNTAKVRNMGHMFYAYNGDNLDVSNFDVSACTSFGGMFFACEKLKTLDVSNWNPISATSFNSMFERCYALETLDTSNWHTDSATSMTNMFCSCKKLQTLDFSNFSFENVTTMSGFCKDAVALTSVTFPEQPNFNKCTTMTQMFSAAGKLSSFNMTNWYCPVLTSVTSMLSGQRSLTEVSMSGWYAPQLTSLNSLFLNCASLKEVDFSDASLGEIKNISSLFNGCSSLTSINWADVDLTSLTAMAATFKNCKKLTNIDLSMMQTGNVTTMAELFMGCSGLKELDVSGLDTHSVTTMASMFQNCSGITELDVSTFDTENVQSMSAMFREMTLLTSLNIQGMDTSNVTNMYAMFYGLRAISELDVSSMNTSSATNMSYMFDGALEKLRELDVTSFDTSNCTNMDHMFRNIYYITELDLSSFDTSKVTNMNYMLDNLRNTKNIYVSERWNTDAVTTSLSMFGYSKLLPNYNASVIDKTNAHYGEGGYLTYRAAPERSVSGASISGTRRTAIVPAESDVLVSEDSVLESEQTIEENIVPDILMEDEEPDIVSGTYGGVDWRVTSTGDLVIGREGQTQSYAVNHGTSWPWKSYKAQIKSVRFEGTVVGYGNHSSMFSGMNMVTFDGAGFDTREITSFERFFYSSLVLQTVSNVKQWDTGNVQNFYFMFDDCRKLTSIDLGGWDTSSVTTMCAMFYHNYALVSADLSGWDVSNVTNMYAFFSADAALVNLDITGWCPSSITTAEEMFSGCKQLTSIDTSSWNLVSLKNAKYMFNGCSGLSVIDTTGWNAQNLTNMAAMFKGCSGVTSINLDGLVTDNVVSMSETFSGCSKLISIDLSGKNTGHVTNMSSLCYNCKALTSINFSGVDTSNVTTMSNMFYYCSSLSDVNMSEFNTENVTSMASMFSGCEKLSELNVSGFNTSSVTNMSNTFANCKALISLDLSNWDTSKVTTMEGMFTTCVKLESLDISTFDTSLVTNMKNMFNQCKKLYVLDVSHFNTGKVTTMYQTFSGMTMGTLDLSSWNTSSCTSMFRMLNGSRFNDTLNLGGTFTMSQATSLTEVFRRGPFQEIPSPNAYIFSGDINLKDTYFSGTTKYIHKIDGEGKRLYNQTAITMTQMSQLTKEEIAGKWVKEGYMNVVDIGDGDYEYISDDNEWVKNGDTWTYTFDVFDDTLQYYLYEEPMEGYLSDAMSSYIIVNSDGNVTKTATIVNTAEVKTGAFEVKKQVVGLNTNQKFTFDVQLSGVAISGNQVFSDVLFRDGHATIQLSDGESKMFGDIPEGTTYTVTESPVSNFVCDVVDGTGEIEDGVIKSAVFINTYVQPEIKYVDLTLAKQVEGRTDAGATFRIVAQFEKLESNKTYLTSKDGVSFHSDAAGNAIVAIELTAGESIQFDSIPVGTKYQFTEEAGAYVPAYIVTDAAGGTNIVSTSGEESTENVSLSTAQEVAEDGEQVSVTFVNTINRTSSLTLTKQVVSPIEETNSFAFTIQFSNLPAGAKINSTIGRFIADEDGNAEKDFTLVDGETLIIDAIPVGTEYRILEDKTKYQASYKISEQTSDGMVVVATGENETQDMTLDTGVNVVHEDRNVDVVVQNRLVRPGTITVKKVNRDGIPIKDVQMRLEYSLDGGKTWLPIESRQIPDNGIYPNGLSSTPNIVNGTLKTDGGGYVTFTGLSVQNVISYRVVEVSTVNGMQLLPSPIMVQAIPQCMEFETTEDLEAYVSELEENNTSILDYEVDENSLRVYMSHVYYTVVNTSVLDMPATGGRGFQGIVVLATVGFITTISMLLFVRKKRKKE